MMNLPKLRERRGVHFFFNILSISIAYNLKISLMGYCIGLRDFYSPIHTINDLVNQATSERM